MRRFAGVASVLFTCAVGCGSDERFTDAGVAPDSERADADTTPDPDAGPPDAGPPTTVHVTTYAYCCDDAPGTPAPGVSVFVIAPDGSAGDAGVTDAAGELTLDDVAPGSSVTAIYDLASTEQKVTFVAVEPGDDLTFGERYYQADAGGADGTMTVTYPAIANPTGYSVVHRCGSDSAAGTALTITITQSAGCQTPTSDLLLLAYDASGLVDVGWIEDAAYTSGAAATLPAWTAFSEDNFTVDATGIPATAPITGTRAQVHYDELGDRGLYTLLTPEGGTIALTTTLTPFGARTWTSNELLYDTQVGSHATYRAGAADATAATLSNPTTPLVGQLAINTTLGTVTWPQAAGAYDGAYARLRWNNNEGTYGDAWDVIFPPGVTSVQWDAVPAAVEAHFPDAAATIDAELTLIDLSSATSYDQLRALPAWQLACPQCAVAEGDQPGADVSFDYGSGEGPVGRYLRPRAPGGGAVQRR